MRAPPLVETLIHAAGRSGFYLSRARATLWIHGGDLAEVQRLDPFLGALRRRVPQTAVVFTSSDARACTWVRTRHTGHRAVAPPWNSSRAAGRFFARLAPVAALVVGGTDRLPLAALRRAASSHAPIAAVLDGAGEEGFAPAAIALVDLFCVGTHEAAARLRSRGARRVVVAASIARGDWAAAEIVEAMADFLDGLPETPRKTRFLERRRTRSWAHSRVGRWIVDRHRSKRIESWDALRRRLGGPRTILCLGNGPTSEDAAVRATPYDCLFRVNHRWLERGILTRPDMVFVGSLSTTLVVPPGCVFGFRRTSKEAEVLLRHLVIGWRLDLVETFTLERVPSIYAERTWATNPTNGAIMILAAAALEPRRIVIAGMDLFDDPRGAYPGDEHVDNAYMAGHASGVDVEIIGAALARFRGEVEILSPNLERALRVRSRDAGPQSGGLAP